MSNARKPIARAHCGECEHHLVTDERHMWCCNARCPQHGERFVFERTKYQARPAPQPEVA